MFFFFPANFRYTFWYIAHKIPFRGLQQSFCVLSEKFCTTLRFLISRKLRSENGTQCSKPAIYSIFSKFHMLKKTVWKHNRLFLEHIWTVISAMTELNTSRGRGTEKWNAKFQKFQILHTAILLPISSISVSGDVKQPILRAKSNVNKCYSGTEHLSWTWNWKMERQIPNFKHCHFASDFNYFSVGWCKTTSFEVKFECQ